MRDTIEAKLADALAPSHLEVLDESHMHNVPAGSQSHFRIRVVSDAFAQRRLVERHRVINELLAAELAGPVHALALETLTADEWRRRREVGRESPECLGGGRG